MVPGSLALAVAASAGLAGCGNTHSTTSGGGTSAPGGSGATVQPSAAAPATKLTVRYSANTGKPTEVWTLTCDPVGGNHPYAKESCALLATAAAKGVDLFARTKTGVMCTNIYGGPETSTVTGTWRGKPVNASFSRKNGCEISRWTIASPLIGNIQR